MKRFVKSCVLILGVMVVTSPVLGQSAGEAGAVADKVGDSQAAVASMRDTLKSVLRNLQDAHGQSDAIKVSCLNDKVTGIKGLLKVAEQADANLQEALARGDEVAADHEFNKVLVASAKSDQLAAESSGCVGELTTYTGETVVEVIIDGSIPTQDPTTETNASVPLFLDRAPVSSPYQ